MTFIFAAATVLGSLMLGWLAGSTGFFLFSAIPFASFAVLWWLDRMSGIPRLLFAAAAGFVFDSMLSRPFGAYMICFFIISCAVEIAHIFFSGRDSRSARIVTGAALIGLFFALLPIAGILAGMARG